MLDRTMDRAWATLRSSGSSTSKREIAGIASTPEPGSPRRYRRTAWVEFDNPLPLLGSTDHDQPVGWATLAKPTKDGVTFTAKMAEVDEPGPLKTRIDDAWQHHQSRAGARAFSIGFRAIERNWMDDGGIRFVKSRGRRAQPGHDPGERRRHHRHHQIFRRRIACRAWHPKRSGAKARRCGQANATQSTERNP